MFRRPVCLYTSGFLAQEIRGRLAVSGGRGIFPEFIGADAFLASVAALEPRNPTFADVVNLAAGWRAAKWAGVAADSALQIDLVGILKGKGFFRGTQPFAVTREIVALFRELAARGVRLPQSVGQFLDMLRAERDRLALHAIAEEAELVTELWYASARLDEDLRRQAEGLRSLAAKVDCPLLVIDSGEFPASLADFIDETRNASLVLRPELGATGEALVRAWCEPDADSEDEKGPAALFENCRIVEGADFEAAALLAVDEIRRHRREDRGRVGVFVFDRVLARRVQALAAEGGLPIEDRSGWVSSTLMVGSMLLLYCDLVNDVAGPHALEDFIASPGSFFQYDRRQRERAVEFLRRSRERRGGIAAPQIQWRELSESGLVVLKDMAKELRSSPMRTRRRRRLHQWISRLLESTRRHALEGVFRGDAPAREITAMLAAHLPGLRHAPMQIRYPEFRAWLHNLMEQNYIAPAKHESDVSFVSMGRAWLCTFDAVVFLGANSDNLPAPQEFVFFNGSLREQLGLDGEQRMMAEQKRNFAAILENHRHASVVWPKVDFAGQAPGESPLIEVARGLKWAGEVERPLSRPPPASAAMAHAPAMAEGAKAVAAGLLRKSERLGVSSYERLMECPFRFYAQDLLRPRQEDEPEEEFSAAEYGAQVHSILERFGKGVLVKPPAGAGQERMHAEMERIARKMFGLAGAGQVGAHVMLEMFRRSMPALAKLEAERREQGWEFAAAEFPVEVPLGTLKKGTRPIVLAGKIDRLDRRCAPGGATELSVTDYKTSRADKVGEKAKNPGESPQVGVYARLLEVSPPQALEGGKVSECRYVRVRDSSESIAHDIDLSVASPQKLLGRLVRLLRQMAAGKPLRANGREQVCRYCVAGGICRKDFWRDPALEPQQGASCGKGKRRQGRRSGLGGEAA